jgi:hypothetical protein
MNPVSVTLTFASYALAAAALSKLDGAALGAPLPRIDHEDRPDVGAPSVEAPAAPLQVGNSAEGNNPFVNSNATIPGGAAAPVVPTPPAAAPTAPTVPTPPSAGTAPSVAPAVVPSATVDLDVSGLPWDGRIHADSGKGKPKPKNADGTWRKKRGMNDEALRIRVEAELRAALAARVPQGGVPVAQAVSLPAAPVIPGVPGGPYLAGIVGVVPTAPLTQPPVVPSAPSLGVPAASPSTASSTAVPSVPPAAPAASIPPVPPSVPAVPAAPTTVVPVPPPATAVSPAVSTVPTTVAETFGTLMARLAPRMRDEPGMAAINTALSEVQLTSVAQLAAAAPDVMRYVSERTTQLFGVPA